MQKAWLGIFHVTILVKVLILNTLVTLLIVVYM